MTRPISLALLASTLLLAPAGASAAGTATHKTTHHTARRQTGPVVLSHQPGSPLDLAARTLAAHDLRSAERRGETPVVLVGSAQLAASGTGDEGLFVQLESASLCGSGGCSTSVYLRHGHHWRLILDSVSGAIRVDKSTHKGMHDLVAGRHDRWIWDGQRYQDTLAAPSMDGLRASMLRHQARHKAATP